MNKKEVSERKIFLKRQLIQVTEREIKALEDELKRVPLTLIDGGKDDTEKN